MGTRGRQSAAALEVVSPNGPIERVKPPHELSDEEVEVWARIVSVEPADKFYPAASVDLLAQYCRHMIQARRIAEMLEKATSDPALEIRDYERLLRMQGAETSQMRSVARDLNLTPKATTNHRGNKLSAPRKPWEV